MFGVPWATLLVMTGIPAALAELRRCLPASMSAAVAFLIGYFVAMLGIGFWAARRVGAVLAVGALFLYLLGQFIAGGAGLESVTGLPFNTALLIAVGVIVAYTFLGGYLAVAYTDFV